MNSRYTWPSEARQKLLELNQLLDLARTEGLLGAVGIILTLQLGIVDRGYNVLRPRPVSLEVEAP